MAEPRHLVLPDGIVSTGWPAVRDTCAQVGIGFDPWQADLNRPLLAKTADGLYAADLVAMSICRQSGKTYDVGGVTFADSIIHPGTLTVWTAHRFKVARESFDELHSMATLPKMAPHIDPDAITTGSGNEVIPFRNGSRIVFAARERGSIRGFRKVRRLVLDEAQILTESQMSDLAPTQNQAWNPQTIMMGTPPKPEDRSEIFTAIRDEALEGKSEGTLYVEYSADPDAAVSGDVIDWEAVAQANPSFPLRTDKRAIRRLKKLLVTDESFAREGLGIWDAHGTGVVIGPDLWALLEDPKSKAKGRVAFSLDVTPGHTHTSICVAGHRADGLAHVEVVDHRPGTKWVLDPEYRKSLVSLAARHKSATFTLDPSGPAGSLLADLEEAGVEMEFVSGREFAQACGHFYVQVAKERAVRHRNEPILVSAVNAGRKKDAGDGAWRWWRRDTDSDISPLVGVTLALWQLSKPGKRVKTGSATFF